MENDFKIGDKVVRKSPYYKSIIGEVKNKTADRCLVHWSNSTGTRRGKHLLRWINKKSIFKV